IDINFHGEAIGIEITPSTGLATPAFDPKYVDGTTTYDTTDQDYTLKRVSITADNTVGLGPGERTDSATFANDEDLYVLFNEEGQIVDFVRANSDPTAWDSNDSTTTDLTGPYTGALVIDLPGADDLDLVIDRKMFFQNGNETKSRTFTQYSQETDAKTVAFDGNSAGSINSFNISSKGEVVGVFTNGERETLAVITLADFDNPAGLEKIGSNMFIDTNNSGVPKYGQPSTGSFGSLNPGALEMSNVDLAKQFTEMITTQRGFQANSRVISTSDEILQELVNLKR
ncbi:MAG: flagellar hook-basal body complex protein, partial [Bacillota bacterium]|nr:flagellar hook-basal body complex protein [Bacillota bacterium]